MQGDIEDKMEKGEVEGQNAGHLSTPTSPTLCDSIDGTLSKSVTATESNAQKSTRWNFPKHLVRRSQSSRIRATRPKYSTPVITRRLNDSAKGYPNVAAFQDSDEGFAIYRRFGWMQSMLILNKQERLRRFEVDLQRLQRRMIRADENAFLSSDIRGSEENVNKHQHLLSMIETEFCLYANLLSAGHRMMAFAKPAESDRQNVGRYLFNRKPLKKEEGTWVEHKEDLITIRAGREHAWLDGIVEALLKKIHCTFIDFLFISRDTRKKAEIIPGEEMPARPPKNEDKYEIYYTPSRIAKLTNFILTALILILLVVPIYVLYHMVHDIGTGQAYMTCIGTLLVFTLVFSSIMSLFTKARRHEILAAAAAYCAVLVVFLGNVGPTGASSSNC